MGSSAIRHRSKLFQRLDERRRHCPHSLTEIPGLLDTDKGKDVGQVALVTTYGIRHATSPVPTEILENFRVFGSNHEKSETRGFHI